MNAIYRWHDALISSAREFEQELSLELDHHSFSQHQFSKRYHGKKQMVLAKGSKQTLQLILRKCLVLLLFILFIVESRSNSSRAEKEPVLDMLKAFIRYMSI